MWNKVKYFSQHLFFYFSQTKVSAVALLCYFMILVQTALHWWHWLYSGQVCVVVWLWLQCRYCANLVPLSSLVYTQSTMHFLQSAHHILRWWCSGAIYWYCSTTASSLGGHNFCRHHTCRCLPSPRGYCVVFIAETYSRRTENIF